MKKIWTVLGIAAALLLIGNAVTQPRKSLQIAALWTPPYPDFLKSEPQYRPGIHDREHVTYRVYYAWNGKRDRHPWWIITKNLDGTWRVIEGANADDYDTETDSVPFDKGWAGGGFRRVARTRFEKIRHVIFGTDNFSRERRTLKKVLELIEVQEEAESKGRDLFGAMKTYIANHPAVASFFPDEREYWTDRFREMEVLFKAEKAKEDANASHNKVPEDTARKLADPQH